MKASKKIFFFVIFCIAVCAIALNFLWFFRDVGFRNWDVAGVDLNLRYNELSCAHEGINSFDIFSRKIHSDKYVGLERSDFPDEDKAGRRQVHAYPPWHIAYCYFIGWLPYRTVSMGLMLLEGISFLLVLVSFWKLQNKVSLRKRMFELTLLLGLVSFHVLWCMVLGNYGVLMCIPLLIMLWALERKCDLIAGVCWGIIMIKPQFGLLMAWPLLLMKKYKVFGVAVAMCLFGTFFASWIFKTSPVELIMQIPQIGAPYAGTGIIATIVRKLTTLDVPMVCSAVMYVLCGVGCYLTRHDSRWFCKLMPVFLFAPIWNYASTSDFVLSWVALAFVISKVCDDEQQRTLFFLSAGFLVALLCYNVAQGINYVGMYYDVKFSFSDIFVRSTRITYNLALVSVVLVFLFKRYCNIKNLRDMGSG